MTLAELKTELEKALPKKVVYYSWPVGQAPKLPYICYSSTGSDNMSADNIVWHSATDVRIELYEEFRDLTTESSVEAALTSAGLFWERSETYIDDERCYEVIYEVRLL